MGDKLGKLLHTLVLFVVINGVLVGAQYLWRAGDRSRLGALQAELDTQSAQLEGLEERVEACLGALSTDAAILAELESELEWMLTRYSGGAPTHVVNDYNRKRERYNQGVDSYNRDLTDCRNTYVVYETGVAHYNALVDEANDLGAKRGGTWILIPIPDIW